MRDRLIELLNDSFAEQYEKRMLLTAQHTADALLAAGVVVPPYKPLPLVDEGESVLCPICETDLMGCYYNDDETPLVVTCYECGAWLDNTKAVTKEEAEKALAERREG